MNIFVSDPNPQKSAQFLDDKRVIKMILESAQMLSTAINEYGGKGPYKSTHINHPCSVWVRANKSNYKWLLDHFEALCYEYFMRYDKQHKCGGFYFDLLDGMQLIPDGSLTMQPNCTIFKEESDIYKAYRDYLNHKWLNDKRKPTWYKKDSKPKQFIAENIEYSGFKMPTILS